MLKDGTSLVAVSDSKLSSVASNKFSIYKLSSKLFDIYPEVLFVTSFPPRECGIATFSQDLILSLNEQFDKSFSCSVCALESNAEISNYDQMPAYILNTDEEISYLETSLSINNNERIELVVIQHEFGFFSKNEAFFKMFYDNILKPIVFVFHTVLPSPDQKLLLSIQDMSNASSAIVVMTKDAAKILIETYNIPSHKITVIPHGTHLISPIDKDFLKLKYDLEGKNVLSTFGLLGLSKSIETTLFALPEIVKHHPDTMFLILGKTHPAVLKTDGEAYRDYLISIVNRFELQIHVRFVNEYLPLPVLLEYLQLTDIYLFTSKDPNQAVSGTFSYAISSGCPVISTPIPHAKEVFENGGGVIIDFQDSQQLADEAISLLDNELLREEISINSFHKMASTVWQNSAIIYGQLFNKLTFGKIRINFRIPPISFEHVRKLTTNFGIIQFSKLSVPDLNSGYTLDDNARALIAVSQHFELFKDFQDLRAIEAYLEFISKCMKHNGVFLNYVNSKYEYSEQNFLENLEDSNGRAIWALGYVYSLKNIIPLDIHQKTKDLLDLAMPNLLKIHSTRAMAFVIKGLQYYYSHESTEIIEALSLRMANMYKHEKNNQWYWFERYLTYANGLLPEAMLCAYSRTHISEYKVIALESFDFLLSIIFIDDKIKVVSNKGWLIKDQLHQHQIGGEQPIDVAYTILALEKFYSVFKKDSYKKNALIAFNWFLGANHLNQIVYNPKTGGCFDGLEEKQVNLNQGAESTLSYLLARLSIARMEVA
jgi:glycosyltransferase involved in cell wall biosynthesis